jgi:alkanesulfonate monooxygenase SsuD/methylene tetrahydromethanopterin reductase-like flavin-dependent oxidoreductase (luciferase family)
MWLWAVMEYWMLFDLRSPSWGVPTQALYEAAVEQAAWADQHGFDRIVLPEHHGAEDGYLPSPRLVAAAMAARTRRVRMLLAVLLAPLHHPVSLAEDLAVLDLLSGGRLDATLGLGYRPSEFEMFGVERKARVRLLEESIDVLRKAFSGEMFDYCGSKVRVTPDPVQSGGPPLFIGGAVPAAAKRAAALGDGFYPAVPSRRLIDEYLKECVALGRVPGPTFATKSPMFVHVTRDPERTWAQVLPYLLHDMNMYGRWINEDPAMQGLNRYEVSEDPLVVKGSPMYRVVTPDECIELVRQVEPRSTYFRIAPLCGGLPPDLAWESLELFASEVLPVVRP